jgi:hypothetical protein
MLQTENKKDHIMIDLEALSTLPNALILSIGAVKFNPFDNNENECPDGSVLLPNYYARVDVESQGDEFDVSEPTMEWWAKQEEHIKDEAFNSKERVPLAEALTGLYRFCNDSNHYWANGSTFDYPILEHAHRACHKGFRWMYWQVKDSRTMMKMSHAEAPDKWKHHALYDCFNQIVGLQRAFKELNIREVKR